MQADREAEVTKGLCTIYNDWQFEFTWHSGGLMKLTTCLVQNLILKHSAITAYTSSPQTLLYSKHLTKYVLSLADEGVSHTFFFQYHQNSLRPFDAGAAAGAKWHAAE